MTPVITQPVFPWGLLIIPEFAFGATVKYINQRIWSERATGLGFDFGCNLPNPVETVLRWVQYLQFRGATCRWMARIWLISLDPDPNNQGVYGYPGTLYNQQLSAPTNFSVRTGV